MKADNTAVPATAFTQTATGYTLYTTSLSDAGTYSLKLKMTLAGYPSPSPFTNYEDATLTWTVTITSPCGTSNPLTAFATLATMTATVSGPAYYQRFTDVTDTFSLA